MPFSVGGKHSEAFKDIEATIAVPQAPNGSNLKAGQAGGRGGRVIRRQESLEKLPTIPSPSQQPASASNSNSASTSPLLNNSHNHHSKNNISLQNNLDSESGEKERPKFLQLKGDCQLLINWFRSDEHAAKDDENTSNGLPGSTEITLSDFRDAMNTLGVTPTVELNGLVDNDDLSTSVRMISLLQSRAVNFVAGLDELKKKEREARQKERNDKKKAIDDAKKMKMKAEAQATLDAAAILTIEAAIILKKDKGGLPDESTYSQFVSTETRFYRYNDRGLQFQSGSAEFTGLILKPDGTFEFKNGYKMEFSSMRKFVEHTEGLFDDLIGTYDIVWGELIIAEDGSKYRRTVESVADAESKGAKALKMTMKSRRSYSNLPNLGLGAKQGSIGKGIGLLGGVVNSAIAAAVAETEDGAASRRNSLSPKKEPDTATATATITEETPLPTTSPRRNSLDPSASATATASTDEPESKQTTTLIPLEIILHPSDQEARRLGKDITQRWGCYAPNENGEVDTIQRKLSPTVDGEVFEFPVGVGKAVGKTEAKGEVVVGSVVAPQSGAKVA